MLAVTERCPLTMRQRREWCVPRAAAGLHAAWRNTRSRSSDSCFCLAPAARQPAAAAAAVLYFTFRWPIVLVSSTANCRLQLQEHPRFCACEGDRHRQRVDCVVRLLQEDEQPPGGQDLQEAQAQLTQQAAGAHGGAWRRMAMHRNAWGRMAAHGGTCMHAPGTMGACVHALPSSVGCSLALTPGAHMSTCLIHLIHSRSHARSSSTRSWTTPTSSGCLPPLRTRRRSTCCRSTPRG